jgi:hypothetical protein
MQTTSRTNHVEESFVFPSLFVPGVLYIITVVYRQSTPSWEKKERKKNQADVLRIIAHH